MPKQQTGSLHADLTWSPQLSIEQPSVHSSIWLDTQRRGAHNTQATAGLTFMEAITHDRVVRTLDSCSVPASWHILHNTQRKNDGRQGIFEIENVPR